MAINKGLMGSTTIRDSISVTIKTLRDSKLTPAQRLELNLFLKELRQELQTVHQVNKARLEARKLKRGNQSQDMGSGTAGNSAEPKT